MKALTPKNQKTYKRLVDKLNCRNTPSKYQLGKASRMPSVSMIAELLKELGIEHQLNGTSCQKYTSSYGTSYYTGGGNKTYEGYTLRVPSINLNIDTTDSCYSANTWGYAYELLELINEDAISEYHNG